MPTAAVEIAGEGLNICHRWKAFFFLPASTRPPLRRRPCVFQEREIERPAERECEREREEGRTRVTVAGEHSVYPALSLASPIAFLLLRRSWTSSEAVAPVGGLCFAAPHPPPLARAGATAGRYGPIDGLRGLPLRPVPPRGDGLPEPVRGDWSGFPAAAGGEGHPSAAVEDPE